MKMKLNNLKKIIISVSLIFTSCSSIEDYFEKPAFDYFFSTYKSYIEDEVKGATPPNRTSSWDKTWNSIILSLKEGDPSGKNRWRGEFNSLIKFIILERRHYNLPEINDEELILNSLNLNEILNP